MNPAQPANILATPFRLNQLTLKNRMVMGPMAANAPRKDGAPSEQTIAFFEARARGGVGMIIVGGLVASKRGAKEAGSSPILQLGIDDFIPEFKRMCDTVHKYGVPIIAELIASMGVMGTPSPGLPNISASSRKLTIPVSAFPQGIIAPGPRTTSLALEATIDQIQALEKEMIDAADRALRAGFDGVEIAAQMSYFAASFVSPLSNWRTDEYGGSVENRARFLTNIVAAIRKRVPPSFIVGLRITGNDQMPDGQGPEGFAEVARRVEPFGIDYVAIGAGCYETMGASVPSVDGELVDSGDARIFKEALSVPLLIQGIHEPRRAGQAIADGHGDLIMLARPLLADPDFPRKVCEDRPAAIVKCLRDHTCLRRLAFHMPVRCDVNPAMGRESRTSAIPPLNRALKAPVEAAILGLTGSPLVMKAIGAMMPKSD